MKKILALILLIAIAGTASALDVPKLTGRVNDYAKVFTAEQVKELDSQLASFESETSNQLVILTIPTTDGESIEQFSIKVAEKWQIGGDKNDNGVIMVIAIKDRKWRIEVGYGLEGALTDALSRSIGENEMVPNFKKGDYAAGITAGVNAIIKATKNEYQPPAKATGESIDPKWFGLLLFLIPFLIAAAIQDDDRRAGGSITGGLLSAVIGYLLFGIIGAVISGIIGAFICIFARDLLSGVADVASDLGSSGGGYYGGGGDSGGGGFSGGGGDFGGGGASGSW